MNILYSQFFDLNTRTAIPWLVIYTLIAFLYFWFYRAEKSLSQFWGWLFPRQAYTSPSFYTDLVLTALNALLSAFALVILNSSLMFAEKAFRLGLQMFASPSLAQPSLFHHCFYTLGLLLFIDLGWFISHVLFHKIDLLWKFHKVHHSAEYLTPLTANRFHPVETFTTNVFIGLTSGAFIGLSHLFFINTPTEMSFLGVNAVRFGLLFFENFRHSHVPVSFGPAEYILSSPAQHQIHHSVSPSLHNKNFGLFFSVWDYLFGFLVLSKTVDDIKVGLQNSPAIKYTSALDCLVRPFAELFRDLIVFLRQFSKTHFGQR